MASSIDGDGLARFRRRPPWDGDVLSRDSTQMLSQRAGRVSRSFSYYRTVSNIVPSSVSEYATGFYSDEYIRSRRQHMGMAGVFASGLPQAMLISLDIIKSNMQVSPNKYRNVAGTVRSLLATGGKDPFSRGLIATLIGYSVHGYMKFSTFDWLQQLLFSRLGPKRAEQHEQLVRGFCMGCAEFVAVIPLCPLAMVKLKMETSAAGSRWTRFVPAVRKMYTNRAKTGFPFRPIFALWGRQIPLAVSQVYLFDLFRSKVSSQFGAEQRHRWKHEIMMLSGFGVAIVSTPLSQPADYVLSRFSVAENRGKSAMSILAKDGVRNALTRGLAPRYVMVGMMTALQFSILELYTKMPKLGH